MSRSSRSRVALPAAAMLALLTGCGGGGGGSSSAPSPSPSPPPAPPPAAQTIAFATPGPVAKTYGDAAFSNVASGGAGTGAITYSSASQAVATVDNAGLVTLVSAGSTVITANKAADATHLAATATYTLDVARASQSIAFTMPGVLTRTFGDAAFSNTAAGGAGTGAVNYASLDTTVATIDAQTGLVTIVASGSTLITAQKAADERYTAGTTTFTLVVQRAGQTVTFAQAGPLSRTFGDPPFTNAATGMGGPGTLTYDSSNSAVASVDASGVVTILGAGSASISATKSGDVNHTSAAASFTLDVARAAQSISFANAGPVQKRVGDAAFINAASGGAGNGAITYTSNDPAVAAVDANTGAVGLGQAGTATITAIKAASANHLQAQASYQVVVAPRPIIEADFTAWLGVGGSADLTLPTESMGATLSTTLAANCPSALSTTCSGVTVRVLTTPILPGALPGIGGPTQMWLRRNNATGRPVTVDVRRFQDALLRPVVFDDQLWLVGANNGAETWSSTDGRAWRQRVATLPWTSRWGAQVRLFNGRFYFVGGSTPMVSDAFNDVWRSDDGTTWTRIVEHAAFAERTDHQMVEFNGRLWIIGGYQNNGDVRFNDVWSSADGITWTQATASAPFAVRHQHSVEVFNGRLWVMGGGTGQYDSTTLDDVWSSADGVTWRPEAPLPFGPRRMATTLVRNGQMYFVGGVLDGPHQYNDVWSTSNGTQWTQLAASSPFGLRYNAFLVQYHNRVLLLGGGSDSGVKNDTWATTDLVNWTFEHTSAPFAPERPGRMVAFSNRLWILGTGLDGKFHAFSSPDGEDWTESPAAQAIPARTLFNVAILNNRLYIQGGFAGIQPFDTTHDVWSTADGETWRRDSAGPPFEARYGNAMFVLNGRMFISGGEVPGAGQRRDIWSSADGTNWRQDSTFAAFGDRLYHRIVVFNGRAWLLGGYGNNPQVWSSADGINWQIEGSPNVASRYQHAMVVHNGSLWILGGNTGFYQPLGDTWTSSDGLNWTQVFGIGAGFGPRSNHDVASFNGKLWLYGGDGTRGYFDATELKWTVDGTEWHSRYHNRIEVP